MDKQQQQQPEQSVVAVPTVRQLVQMVCCGDLGTLSTPSFQFSYTLKMISKLFEMFFEFKYVIFFCN